MVQTMQRILFPFLVILSMSGLLAQSAIQQRPSPMAIARVSYKDTYVKITYGQPQKRGREIFGGLVPYNAVWRTGANEASEVTATRDIFINGTLVPAGTYSIFSIPNKETWTIIINKETGLWGSYNYNQKLDLVRFELPVQSTDQVTFESFTLQFDQRNNVADLLIQWDKTKIVIPFQFIEPKL